MEMRSRTWIHTLLACVALVASLSACSSGGGRGTTASPAQSQQGRYDLDEIMAEHDFDERGALEKLDAEYDVVSIVDTDKDEQVGRIAYTAQVEKNYPNASVRGTVVETLYHDGGQWKRETDNSGLSFQWNVLGEWACFEEGETEFDTGCVMEITAFDLDAQTMAGSCTFFYPEYSPTNFQWSQRSFSIDLADASVRCEENLITLTKGTESVQIRPESASCEFYDGWGNKYSIEGLAKAGSPIGGGTEGVTDEHMGQPYLGTWIFRAPGDDGIPWVVEAALDGDGTCQVKTSFEDGETVYETGYRMVESCAEMPEDQIDELADNSAVILCFAYDDARDVLYVSFDAGEYIFLSRADSGQQGGLYDPVNDELFSLGETAAAFQGVMGSVFSIPTGFVQQDIPTNNGYLYSFYHDELEMMIQVGELSFAMLPESPEAIMRTEFESARTAENVTDSEQGDGWYEVTGFMGDGIFYRKVINAGDAYRYEIYVTYPSYKEDSCVSVLDDFLHDFQY